MRYLQLWCRRMLLICSLALIWDQASFSQSVHVARSRLGVAPLTQAIEPGRPVLVREIADLTTKSRWLLLRNAVNPGGPGRLMQEKIENAGLATPGSAGGHIDSSLRDTSVLPPIIRAGDRLVISEQSLKLDARFDGVAMQPSAAGGSFHVRLKFNGKIMIAIAQAPGRATLCPLAEQGGAR